MSSRNEEIVLYESPKAASRKMVEAWVSRDGFAFFTEHGARTQGATHRQCKNPEHPPYIKMGYCSQCAKEKTDLWYASLPSVEYTGGVIYSHSADRYFSDLDDLEFYIDEFSSDDLRLSPCSEQSYTKIAPGYWYDDMPEDQELPAEILAAVEELNSVLAEHKLGWYPENYRLDTKQVLAFMRRGNK